MTSASSPVPGGARQPMKTPARPEPVVPTLPIVTRIEMVLRLFMIQSAWNYELLLGNGIGFCVEPALRRLPGGRNGSAYREALARQSQYFNAHPYLAAVAVGSLARAELERAEPARIERFRTALCGPLGSVGDRLVWAGWLPFCSLLGLAAYGVGAGPLTVLLLFFGLYNAGHVALRAWGLSVGWRRGMRVAPALANPVLREGPGHLARATALVAGIALPLALGRAIGPGRGLLGGVVLIVALMGALAARLPQWLQGWRLALGVLALWIIYALAQHTVVR
ncbi:MAG TPA: PTS system mannose/fructose/sorbose family transporter subunit IID [Gemmatimonadaceae bacterium]|nr:PTS system mannose/fructose/sorbose family transporter subunit IID [Gemmatimonadaceae bacterium]